MSNDAFEELLEEFISSHWRRDISPDLRQYDKPGTEAGSQRRRMQGVYKKTKRRFRQMVYIAVLAVLVLSAFVWVFQDDLWSSSTLNTGGFPRAVLIDQLSKTYPNPSFTETVDRQLSTAGYTVDYYGPSDVSIRLFQNLPSNDYRIIIIRAHSALAGGAAVATSEPYSQYAHLYEQLTDQVVPISVHNGTAYFAITPEFVRDHMHGRFQGSIIVMMGCWGLEDTALAEAFLERGAGTFVGWTTSVTAAQTDTATLTLLEALAQGKTVRDAVASAADSVAGGGAGASSLAYYDSTVQANQRLTIVGSDFGLVLAVFCLILLGSAIPLFMTKIFGRL
jgi:hypothetical protein